jgi:drug/metabolite transporter (DMT)-like permease
VWTNSWRRNPHPLGRGYFYIAAAALLWGVSATLGRAAFTGRLAQAAVPIDAVILAQSRATLSLLVLLPLLLLRRGRTGISLPRAVAGRSLLLGVLGLAASNYFYYLAIQRTNVATAITLQYTAPIWVLVYTLLRRREPATWRRALAVALAVLGIALVLNVVGRGGFRMDAVGVVAAQLAALSFAYYNLAGATLLARTDRWRLLVWALLGAALFWQLVNPLWKVLATPYTGGQWLFLAGFAVVSMLLPFSCYFGGLQRLDATRAIVTSCLEPVFAIVIAAAVLRELVNWTQVVGIAVVLAATVLVQMPARRVAGACGQGS